MSESATAQALGIRQDELTVEHHNDFGGIKIGMWLFLMTEVLLFGGMFILYCMYRYMHATEFHTASALLDVKLGALNTAILLTSSLTMALSIATLQRGQKTASYLNLGATILFGGLFMVNKYFEWTAKFHHGIYPNSDHLGTLDQGYQLFYGLYFTMTGLHGLHVVVGMGLLTWMLFHIRNKPHHETTWALPDVAKLHGAHIAIVDAEGQQLWTTETLDDDVREVVLDVRYEASPQRMSYYDIGFLENCGLYWHLVDLVWIFLFPLFYLIS